MGFIVMQALAASMPIVLVCLCVLDRNVTPAAYFASDNAPVEFDQVKDRF